MHAGEGRLRGAPPVLRVVEVGVADHHRFEQEARCLHAELVLSGLRRRPERLAKVLSRLAFLAEAVQDLRERKVGLGANRRVVAR